MSNTTYRNNGSFKYKHLSELQKDIEELRLDIKVSNNIDLFKKKIYIDNFTIPNSIASLPMEGGDSSKNGSPTELTYRKYERIARGGSGLIWLEAVSISKEGRSNDKQLWLTEENWTEFKKLNDLIKTSAKEEFGEDYKPITIIQLNHSGRYCKVNGKSSPIIATHKKLLDDRLGISEDHPVVTDDYLRSLEDDFLKSAKLAKKAGFDGVDIKACHGYLLSELLSAYEREGEYGGKFENRIKLLTNVIDKIRADIDCEGLLIGTRLNLYDAVPYPQGWGVSKSGGMDVDLQEPKALIKILEEKGVKLISLTMGNPYFVPHINKPYDIGNYTPDENAIISCNRLINEVGNIQKTFPNMNFVGVGYSWFRSLAPYVGAGSLENGLCNIVGFGREGIAYPDFAKDILNHGEMISNKACISCSKCSEMKSKIGTCGCVIRDNKVYLPIYKKM
ncbi:MAG: flavin oxidoreductase/NADH oxidase [Tissierella sp.]|nr:flavin oxidoreductase/NADH oxidase [Tissierella sp.]